MTDLAELERRLWAAADALRAKDFVYRPMHPGLHP
jgi:hypothetical protein